MQTRLFFAIGRNRYTVSLLVLVATLFLSGASDAGGCKAYLDTCSNCDNQPEFPATITATVTDSVTGKGIPGGYVTNDSILMGSDTLNDGSVEFKYLFAGSYTLTAAKAGYASNSASVSVERNSTAKVQIPLTPSSSGTIMGTVTDARTKGAIAGALVFLSSLGIPDANATTDATGVYRFASAPAGVALTLVARADKYDSKVLTLTPLSPNENRTGVDFELTQTVTATGSMTVTVLDATTAARVPATAITSASFGGVPLVFSSSAGTYGLTAAPAGANIPLSVSATGFTTATRNLTLATGQNLNLTIPLSPVIPTTSTAPVCESSGKSYRITLDWQRDAQGRSSDLQLLLTVPSPGIPAGCYLDRDYSGNLCTSPYAQLRVESTRAPGKPAMETVDISQLTPGTYQIAVYDYSGEIDPPTTLGDPKTAATVTVYGPKGTVTATAPVAPPGGYWNWIPFTIDGATGEIKPATPSILGVGKFLPSNTCGSQ